MIPILKNLKANIKFRRGFTLVEVALTAALASVVSLAIYSTLSYGLKIWQKVQIGVPEEDVAIFFSKINDELENTFAYPDLKFFGNQTALAFPSMVFDRAQDDASIQVPGLIKYEFSEGKMALEKISMPPSEIYSGRNLSARSALESIGNFSFSYYFLNKDKEEYTWCGEWPPLEGTPTDSNFPLAVRIAVAFVKANKTYEYAKSIFLPLAK